MQPISRLVPHTLTIAIASAGLWSQANAATFPVESGVINVTTVLTSGAGGGGGLDASGAGGQGGSGTAFSVTLGVQGLSSISYQAGVGGGAGGSWSTTSGTTSGGTGGAGSSGIGGDGGDGTQVKPSDVGSGSGAGGGGGSASWVNAGSLWAVAGGGGGGGGGSWLFAGLAGSDATAPNGASTCAPPESGEKGNQIVQDPTGVANGGGGGGGGGGGYAKGTAGTLGYDGNGPAGTTSTQAGGGGAGGSCYSSGITLNSPVPTGTTGGNGADASKNPAQAAAKGGDGSVSLIPNAVPTLTAGAPNSGEITVNASLPTPVYPAGFVPTSISYAFTCDNGMSVPLGSTLPVTIKGLTNNTQYSCTVIATISNGTPAQDIVTPISDKAQATLSPVAGPGSPASVPTLSEWALMGLSSILAMFGIARMRRRQS